LRGAKYQCKNLFEKIFVYYGKHLLQKTVLFSQKGVSLNS